MFILGFLIGMITMFILAVVGLIRKVQNNEVIILQLDDEKMEYKDSKGIITIDAWDYQQEEFARIVNSVKGNCNGKEN